MSVGMQDLPDGRLLVGGEWRVGGGAPIASRFPGDMSLNREFAGACGNQKSWYMDTSEQPLPWARLGEGRP